MAHSSRQQDVQDALRQFRSEAEKVIESFVQTLPKEPPPIIYHYTNEAGLRGILETGQIWLTDIFRLNDPSELRHGLGHALEMLKTGIVNGSPEFSGFARGLETFFRHVGVEECGHFFLCSFSSCGDDLGQWRAYADNGRGYALGFDGKALESGFTGAPSQNTEGFYVTYDDGVLDKVLGQVIEAYLRLPNLGRILRNRINPPELADLYTWLSVYLLRVSLFFKHQAYSNEKEYRFLEFFGADVPPPNMKLRARPYSLVRYREFDWRKVRRTSLRKIVVGPSADKEKASLFARDCLGLFHTELLPITYSDIPYRAA